MDGRAWGRWWRIVGRPAVVMLLATAWNPIDLEAGDPANEYDSVADPIGAKLRDGASASDIAAELAVRRGHWSLPSDGATDARAADVLVAWYTATLGDSRVG